MSFCYSCKAFMLDTVAKAYEYFIIIFVLNTLFIQFSLSPSLSLSFPLISQWLPSLSPSLSLSLLGFEDLGASKKYLSPRKWLQRNGNEKAVRDRRIRGAALSPIHLRSTETPEAPDSGEPETKTCGFFLGVTVWFLSHWPSLFLSSFSLAATAGPHMASHSPKASTATRSHSLAVGLWLIDEDWSW